jgi:hypothetical protein
MDQGGQVRGHEAGVSRCRTFHNLPFDESGSLCRLGSDSFGDLGSMYREGKPRDQSAIAITYGALWPKIEQFVTAITAKARHSGYATSCTMKKGETL